MVDFLDSARDLTGIGGGSSGGIGATTILTFVAVFLIVAILVGVGVFFFARWYQYKYTVKVFKKINGRFQELKQKIKAKAIPIKNTGEIVLLLNKPKKILPFPSIESSLNTFNYFISEDGEWINFEFSDFDDDRRAVGSQFLDKEMRYARTSLQHMGEERYKPTGWKEYIPVIIGIVTILICGIILWLMADKLIDLSGSVQGAVETSARVMEKAEKIIGTLDNIETGGSGIIPA